MVLYRSRESQVAVVMRIALSPRDVVEPGFGTRRRALCAGLSTGFLMAAWIQVRAQTSRGDAAAANARIAANPLLEEFRRSFPQQLPLVLDKLEILSSPAGGGRGPDARPTSAETNQIAQNPAVAAAFERKPQDTLNLLRWLNQQLRSGVR